MDHDIFLIILFVFLGGLLGLVVEAQRKLYHIYFAIFLLAGAGLLGVVEKLVARIAES